MRLQATLLLGHYSQKPLTLKAVENGSTDHLEDIRVSRIMGQTRTRLARRVLSQLYKCDYTALRFALNCATFCSTAQRQKRPNSAGASPIKRRGKAMLGAC